MSLASTLIALAAESSATVAASSTATGGSSTAATVTPWVSGVPNPPASRTVYVTVRVAVLGLSLVLRYVTSSSATSYAAIVAVPLSVSVPVAV